METIYNNLEYIMDDVPLSETKYLLRKSDRSSSTSKQRHIIESFIEEHSQYLPSMTDSNTIEETISGTKSPYDRFLYEMQNQPLCLSNLDRVLKSKSLYNIKALHFCLMHRNIRVLLANRKEYYGLIEIRNLINKRRKALDQYIEFVSDRMNESLDDINNRKGKGKAAKTKIKERKGIRSYCIKYLNLIKKAFREVSCPDFKLWIIACLTGHLINKYLKDNWRADASTRLPKLNIKELLVLRTIEINHPDKNRKQIHTYSSNYNNSNKKYDSDKLNNYTIDLKPKKISKLRKSRPYSMLLDYENGKFEKEIEEIYSKLKTPKYKLSWKGLSKAEIRKIIKHFPKIKGLRSWQLKTIKYVNHGNHTVLQVMAGGGKSLAFQLPAMMGKMIVVISPFRTLIKNQAESLRKIIPTAFINSDVSAGKRRNILKRIENGEISLLFLTPEQLNTEKVKHAWKTIKALKGRVDLLVLDEAHHPKTDSVDFREAYDPISLNKAWKKLGRPQTLFLSASLRKESYKAIKRIIKGEKLKIVKGPLTKPNVGLIKNNFDGPEAEAAKIIWAVLMVRRLKKMGIKKVIVYVNKPRKVVYMMKQLMYDDNRNVYGVHGKKEGVEIHSYHEDGTIKERILLSPSEIKKGQEDFEKVKTGVMPATSAYAEGIDSDAGAVIVLDLPVNIETLYQEVLRCGHQGQKGLAFICVDDKADNFNKMALLKGDKDKMEQYDRDYEFLREDADDDLWKGLTKPFLKRS